MKKITLLILVALIAIAASLLALYKINSTNKVDLHNFTLISSLTAKDGGSPGNVYVKYISDGYFTDLYIVGKNDEVLYKMDNTGFSNAKGKDGPEIEAEGFYGYKIREIGTDYFDLNYYRNGGKIKSDDAVVHWNYKKKIFEF